MTAASPTIGKSRGASLAERLARRDARAPVRPEAVGFRLSFALCRLRARAQRALVGGDHSRAGLSAGAGGLAAQIDVPNDRNRHRRDRDRGPRALFRQDRAGFLVGLALWCAASAFVATLLRNFAAYAAALAGYTAAIIAIDVLGPVGSTNGIVLIFAIDRSLEICIGIVCAGVVLALDRSRPLAAKARGGIRRAVDGDHGWVLPTASGTPAPTFLQFQALRRDLLRRVIALDPMIDAAIGEASDLRYRSAVLQRAVSGLMETISAWRKAAFAIARNGDASSPREAQAIHDQLPRGRLSPGAIDSAGRAQALREACCVGGAVAHTLRRRRRRSRGCWRTARRSACSAWRARSMA